jgi:hypothetical protein
MVLKKVLGFATTTSLILLVMVAPTTTTATASLQQQEGNATIDEPNIPIGPADEGPDEPIPNNENETRNDDDDNGTISCKDIGYPFGGVDEYPDVPYCPGNNGYTYEKPETWINWVKGKSLDGGSYVKIRDGAVTTSHRFIVDFQSTATDTGKGSYVQFNIDKGPWKHVASPYKFSIPSCSKHTIF